MRLNDIYRHAATRADHLAVVNNGAEFTYRRFAGMIEAVRRHIAAQAIPREGVVAIMGDSLIFSWVLQLALRSLGHTTLKAGSWEMLDGLHLRDLSAIAAFDRNFADWDHDPAARRNCAALRVPAQVLAQADTIVLPDLGDDPVPGDHVAFTSGTTGTYKKVRFSGSGFADRLDFDERYDLAYRPDDVVHLESYGEWTIVGYQNPLRAWTVGATVVFDSRENWAEHFFDYPVSSSFLIVPIITAILNSGVRQPQGYPTFEIRLGGGFIAAAVLQQLQERFDCRFVHMYGATEFATALVNDTRNIDDFLWMAPTQPGRLEIVGDDGRAVADEVPGEVRVRLLPWEPAGYRDDPDGTAQFYRGGYFYPGDMAVRRPDGRVRIVGRVHDVLVIDGQKLPVRPHEERAQDILGVDNVCLFARQTSRGDVILLVVLEGEELPPIERLQTMAAGYRDAFSDAKFVTLSHFPRGANGMGKIDRQAVLALVEHLVA
jgi:acyl-coenzyme A synthetase/AMP-(fatty) acid ligase